MSQSTKTKLLITGAAGRIGSVVTAGIKEQYDLKLSDIKQPQETYGCPFVEGDIADLDSMRALCTGVDIVIHLAANPSPNASWESLLPSNIIGVYNVFQAAHEAGCRRVVYASSVQTVLGYPEDVQVTTTMPTYPANLYGATKVWGEAAARSFTENTDLSIISMRIGWFIGRDNKRLSAGEGWPSQVLFHEDMVRFAIACIEAPAEMRYGVFHGLSNNRRNRFDISDGRELLGYDPQEDAYEIAERAQNGDETQ